MRNIAQAREAYKKPVPGAKSQHKSHDRGYCYHFEQPSAVEKFPMAPISRRIQEIRKDSAKKNERAVKMKIAKTKFIKKKPCS